ncbi:Sigma intracellular receptor 2 [Manis javanica]|nr:Sigma intracellular receptor 2 [Manis javanica]
MKLLIILGMRRGGSPGVEYRGSARNKPPGTPAPLEVAEITGGAETAMVIQPQIHIFAFCHFINQEELWVPGVAWLLGLYFLFHIPIALLMDLKVELPHDLSPDFSKASGFKGQESKTCQE